MKQIGAIVAFIIFAVGIWAVATQVNGPNGEAPPIQSLQLPSTQPLQLANGCGLVNPAFCDTFNAPFGVFNRSGQLDGTIWGVSRMTGNQNISGNYNRWHSTTVVGCGGPSNVMPPYDVAVCGGQLHESTNDNVTVTVLAMYPKQPFDFAGRVGKVTFDVGNDTVGTHAAWPEFWMSDKPVPAPFSHEDSWVTMPQHGFGIRFAANGGPCGTGKWTVDSAVVSRNYVPDGDLGAGQFANNSTLTVNSLAIGGSDHTGLDCVTMGSPSALNHIEIRVSQGTIDVWAGDAGSAVADKHLASIPNANLSFTRGLIWIEDAHYNANKVCETVPGQPCHREHTFVWDNVGFDGPFTYRDLSFDVKDACDPCSGDTDNLGWKVLNNSAEHLNVNTLPMATTQIGAAQSSRLLFNFLSQDSGNIDITYIINGHSHVGAWPFPGGGNSFNNPKTVAFDVPLSDLKAGANNIELWASTGQALIVANVNIVLVNVGGTPLATPTPPPPTSTVPAASTPTTVPTIAPTSTVAPPLPTATKTATITGPSPTKTPKPILKNCVNPGTKWGSTTIGTPTSFGQLTKADCALHGQ